MYINLCVRVHSILVFHSVKNLKLMCEMYRVYPFHLNLCFPFVVAIPSVLLSCVVLFSVECHKDLSNERYCVMLLLYLFADEQFKVGLDLDIYVEIKPRSLSGVILSVYSSRGDYLVLQVQDGNVSISPEHLGYQDSSGFAILN